MSDLKKIAPLLRHPDKEQRRFAIQSLGKLKEQEALKYLAWLIKNEQDAELKSLAIETGNKLHAELKKVPQEETFVLDESLFDEPLPSKAYQELDESLFDEALPSKSDEEVDESLFDEALPANAYKNVNVSKAEFDAKARRVQPRSNRYDIFDTFLGLLFSMAFVLSLTFGNWFDLRLLEPERSHIQGDLQYAQHNLPNEGVARALTIIPLVCYALLMMVGVGLVALFLPFDIQEWLGALRWLIQDIPPRLFYIISLILVICIFGATWFWYSAYASSLLLTVMDTRNINVENFSLIGVTSLRFWAYLVYLIVLISACIMGINRHSQQNSAKN